MARTTQKVAADTNVQLIQNTFTRAGYRFDKWNTKADGTGTSYADQATVKFDGDVLLYAIWRLATPLVILKSNSDSSIWPLINANFPDGVVDKTVVATYGQTYPTGSIPVPTSQGYTFDMWKCSNNNQFYNNLSSTICNIDADIITFLAQWKANSYTVTLDQQSGTGGTSSVTAIYGNNMPSATMPTRDGHTFGGYYSGTSGTGTQYYTSSGASARRWNIAGNAPLYAYWI